MYILKIKSKSKDKEYTSVVLAKNYREDGKIKRKILTTLTDWPESRIEEIFKRRQSSKDRRFAIKTRQEYRCTICNE